MLPQSDSCSFRRCCLCPKLSKQWINSLCYTILKTNAMMHQAIRNSANLQFCRKYNNLYPWPSKPGGSLATSSSRTSPTWIYATQVQKQNADAIYIIGGIRTRLIFKFHLQFIFPLALYTFKSVQLQLQIETFSLNLRYFYIVVLTLRCSQKSPLP